MTAEEAVKSATTGGGVFFDEGTQRPWMSLGLPQTCDSPEQVAAVLTRVQANLKARGWWLVGVYANTLNGSGEVRGPLEPWYSTEQPMTPGTDLKDLALGYAIAQADLKAAERKVRSAEDAVRTTRDEIDRLRHALGKHVGANVRVRNVVIEADGVRLLVRVEHSTDNVAGKPVVHVTCEEIEECR